jgi:acetyl-CoA C-acetyltransferase
MQKNKTPVVIGVSSITQKGKYEDLDEALILMDIATKSAIEDCGNPDIKKYINEISIPKGYWKYRDPGKWIAKNNNIKDIKTSITKIGVLQQNLINKAALKIQKGNIGASLLIGGESRYKRVIANKLGKKYIETELKINPDQYIKAESELRLDEEEEVLGQMAVGYYSILESAYRASKKNSIEDHNRNIANLYEKFSKIAVNNKNSWVSTPKTNKDILEASNTNPKQSFPYNKLHCTSWNVNQSSALIICSEDIADKLNIAHSKRVYPLASSESNNMIPTLLRRKLIDPLGIKLAAKYILDICKTHGIQHNTYDLYSCFPIAVQMFADALKLKNRQDLTVTGGMAFAGGPLNHYVMTSTVKMIDEIRNDISKIGIVTGVSGMMTKQSFAIWAKKPLEKFYFKDVSLDAQSLDKPLKISNQSNGKAVIIGYTIMDDQKGPKAVLYVEDLNNDRKILISRDNKYINDMEKNEWVGKEIDFNGRYLV